MLLPVRRLRVLVLPWAFLLILIVIYVRVGWPLLVSGHVVGAIFGSFLGVVLASFVAAALTLTRDVLRRPSRQQ